MECQWDFHSKIQKFEFWFTVAVCSFSRETGLFWRWIRTARFQLPHLARKKVVHITFHQLGITARILTTDAVRDLPIVLKTLLAGIIRRRVNYRKKISRKNRNFELTKSAILDAEETAAITMIAEIILNVQNGRNFLQRRWKIRSSVLLEDLLVSVLISIFILLFRVELSIFTKRVVSESPRIPPPICGACAYPQRLNPGEVQKSFQRTD